MLYVCRGYIPELTGKRLRLRMLEAGDAEDMLRCWADEDVRKFADLPSMPDQKSAVEMINVLNHFAETDDGIRWGIMNESGRIIGSCGFNWWQLEGAYRGEISCELSRDYWGHGYMHEALGLLIDFGFHVMGLNRIEALTHPENTKANRLFQSLGFQDEAVYALIAIQIKAL
ncbi:GNAT family N-acetyltransferase [Paenibacillus pini]|uniref:N-acetyltransferase n=1 Tax=Paenibacillus pini JCM 16418 TaxID=1236976 RepID=W7YQ41_9BACL|nr:GNAT family N-acetyltransferase [Paenibacillus pini]GAF09603.1 N-acetyltransferase [Paenibacillus pini JCM 16418]